mgnify:CR=1 FL=1
MQRLNTRLTITQILRWADRHHDLTGRWPNRFSKSVAGLDMGEERWSAIEGALFGGSREIGLQTNGALAGDMTFNELYGLGYKAGWKYAENISAVTLDDVQRVARQYLDPDIRAEIVVGPPDTAGAKSR